MSRTNQEEPMSNDQAFIKGYIDGVFFAGVSDEDRHRGAELSPEAVGTLTTECEAFTEAAYYMLRAATRDGGYTYEQAGVDFFLTRNGHGAGFWDRGLGLLGDALSELAKSFGTADVMSFGDGVLEHLS